MVYFPEATKRNKGKGVKLASSHRGETKSDTAQGHPPALRTTDRHNYREQQGGAAS